MLLSFVIGILLVKLFLTLNNSYYWSFWVAAATINGQFECKLCLNETISQPKSSPFLSHLHWFSVRLTSLVLNIKPKVLCVFFIVGKSKQFQIVYVLCCCIYNLILHDKCFLQIFILCIVFIENCQQNRFQMEHNAVCLQLQVCQIWFYCC